MDNITNETYAQMVKKASPSSRGARNIPLAFVVGGAICTLGHFFIQMFKNAGLSDEIAFPAGSIALVFLAILLTGLNAYDKLARLGGAGTLVPITGFANAIAAPALEFKSEGFVLGLGAKMFTVAGPVIVYGIAAGIIYGAAILLFGLQAGGS